MTGVYLIGEIGQNHNGSAELARHLIDELARRAGGSATVPGLDAIKLTKRDLDHELAESQRREVYDNPHAFGRTYGEHRERLELSDEEHAELCDHTHSVGLEFVVTLCAPSCLSLLELCTPDRLKVASRDLTNLPLLDALADTGIPMILSRGMSGRHELDAAIDVVTRHHDRVTLLHCVSEYPTSPANAHLRTISFLRARYARFAVGYSDHTEGITAAIAAVAMGAELIEKHVTLDRSLKGSDHAGSLEPDEMTELVRQVRFVEQALGDEAMVVPEAVGPAQRKLERSVATNRRINAGELIAECDLHLLSPGTGLRWADRGEVIGRRAVTDIPANEVILPECLKTE